MVAPRDAFEKGARKRKAHTKSRKGCRNCKLRGVKCDEGQPSCKRCLSYGTACNYSAGVPELETVFDGTLTMKLDERPSSQQVVVPSRPNHPPKLSIPMFMYPPVISQDSEIHMKLNSQELDTLGRFYTRTILAVGPTASSMYFQGIIVGLACSNPCLMHVIQGLTSIHDRYLSSNRIGSNSKPTKVEAYHLSRATRMFSKELSKPVEPSRRDALWAIAVLLSVVTWASIEATCPEEAWPYAESKPGDLTWIVMSEKKPVVWKIVDPTRPESLFYGLAQGYQKSIATRPVDLIPCIDDIPHDFRKLYELDEYSTTTNSPYFLVVWSLAKLLPLDCSRDDMIPFIGFIVQLTPEFKELLWEKDPLSLLVIAFWYMKVGDRLWSLAWRAKLEAQSICLYLGKYHWHNQALMQLLREPRQWCAAPPAYP